MSWTWTAIGLIVLALVLGATFEFAGYLLVTHQSCAATSTSSEGYGLFGITSTSTTSSNATIGAAAPLSPVPASADLVLAPLATLPIGQGNYTAITDLTNVTYWQEVHAAEYQTYEQILPGTVMGFINGSQEWKSWALQYIPDSPSWLTGGFVNEANGQLVVVDPTSGGGRDENSTSIEKGIKDFAASAAGLDLAAFDYVSFNGLTALKVLLETGDAKLAACQTLPGQLAQLYLSSFDVNVPQPERAKLLGTALAITGVMIIVGGKDGFTPKFQAAIHNMGLGDSWATVKPYLGDIGSKASAGASSATLAILQTLAQRFPQDSAWATGLTADRIDSMLGVLQDAGLQKDAIQAELQKVAQAAGSSRSEDGAADAADEVAYHDGHWLQAIVTKDGKLSVYQDATGRTKYITVDFLKSNLPGFDPQRPNFIMVGFRDQSVAVYRYYSGPDNLDDLVDGGRQWRPSIPTDIAAPGADAKVQLTLLTPEVFAERMPNLQFNDFGLRVKWMAATSKFTSYSVSGDELKIGVTQAVAGLGPIPDYEIDGVQSFLYWDGKVTSLDFQFLDAYKQSTEMRLVYDGYKNPQFRIVTGQTDYAQVLLVSSDGVRLKFLYNTGPDKYSTATIYVKPASELWSLSAQVPGDPRYLASGGTAVYKIDGVTPTRSLEAAMIRSDSPDATYDKGVMGAEIAYTVGTGKLGLHDLILHESSEGGPDLNTPDKTTFIEARLLDLHDIDPTQIPTQIQSQLPQLITALNKDFSNNKGTATMGYVIISYIEDQYSVKAIIVQVPYP